MSFRLTVPHFCVILEHGHEVCVVAGLQGWNGADMLGCSPPISHDSSTRRPTKGHLNLFKPRSWRAVGYEQAVGQMSLHEPGQIPASLLWLLRVKTRSSLGPSADSLPEERDPGFGIPPSYSYLPNLGT